MPNVGHKWTPEEERDAVEFDWPIFHAMHPGISKDAHRIRRGALRRQPQQKPSRLRSLVRRLVGA